jgi:hypothetical protein
MSVFPDGVDVQRSRDSRTASVVAPTSPAARAVLTMRAQRGSRSSGAADAPTVSHVALITTTMAVSTAVLAMASVIAASVS